VAEILSVPLLSLNWSAGMLSALGDAEG